MKPWTHNIIYRNAVPDSFFVSEEGEVLIYANTPRVCTSKEIEFRAKLIAAAPELLKAAENALNALEALPLADVSAQRELSAVIRRIKDTQKNEPK